MNIKKVWLGVLLCMSAVSAWEVNTHRAIDREAIERSFNLTNFLTDTGNSLNTIIDDAYLTYEEHPFYTYFTYITYSGDAMSSIGLDFEKHHIQNLIEAGTVLEDALRPGASTPINGRFLNHFLNPQDGDDGFLGYTDALYWASRHPSNKYSYLNAKLYFKNAFMLPNKNDRETNKARMFVSLGHIMHLFNDMNSDYIQRSRT